MKGIREIISDMADAKTVKELHELRPYVHLIIPIVDVLQNYDQNNSAHQYDLYEHTLHTVINLNEFKEDVSEITYFAAYLHDIGKPYTRVVDKKGEAHYPNHGDKGYEILLHEILPEIKDKLTDDEMLFLAFLVKYHDSIIRDDDKYIGWIKEYLDKKEFRNYMYLHIADAKAHKYEEYPKIQRRIDLAYEMLEKADDIFSTP